MSQKLLRFGFTLTISQTHIGFQADEWARSTTFHHNIKIYLQMRTFSLQVIHHCKQSFVFANIRVVPTHLYFKWSFPDIEHMQGFETPNFIN